MLSVSLIHASATAIALAVAQWLTLAPVPPRWHVAPHRLAIATNAEVPRPHAGSSSVWLNDAPRRGDRDVAPVDAVSREFSFCNAQPRDFDVRDAVSRELSYYNSDTVAELPALVDAVSREYTYENESPPLPFLVSDVLSRELSFYNDSPHEFVVHDTLSREYTWFMFRLGDLNCDSYVDTADIDAFVLAIVDADAYAAAYPDCLHHLADCNSDGQVDTGDIDAFVQILVRG